MPGTSQSLPSAFTSKTRQGNTMSLMSAPIITGFYAAVMGLLLLWLDVLVFRERGKTGISLYDGGNKELATGISHSNEHSFAP